MNILQFFFADKYLVCQCYRLSEAIIIIIILTVSNTIQLISTFIQTSQIFDHHGMDYSQTLLLWTPLGLEKVSVLQSIKAGPRKLSVMTSLRIKGVSVKWDFTVNLSLQTLEYQKKNTDLGDTGFHTCTNILICSCT